MLPKSLFHATRIENMTNITLEGLKPMSEGVFFSDSVQNAAKFLMLKMPISEIIVFEIATKDLDKKFLEESFDHSFEFFQCRAWVYAKPIPYSKVRDIYDFNKKNTTVKASFIDSKPKK